MNIEIESIMYPVLVLGGLGFVFASGLAYASQKFHVEVDPKITEVRDVLPGANCGACGVPGCDGFARGVVAGELPVDGCPVGGSECAEAVAKIMGVESNGLTKMVAKVICNGDSTKCKENFVYEGIEDCTAAALVRGGSKSCSYGCLGLSTCVRACPFDAIEITEEKIAKIIIEKCTGCKKCVIACPKNVIDMVPYDKYVVVACNNKEPAKVVRPKCSVSCIGCKICVKACPVDAIGFDNNLAIIDYEKCINCFICEKKCPTKAIEGELDRMKEAKSRKKLSS